MAMRLITSGVGLIVFFAAFFANEFIFSLAVMMVAAVMVYEVVSAIAPGKLVCIVSVVLTILTYIAVIAFGKSAPLLLAAVFAGIFIYLILSVFLYKKIDFLKIYSSGIATIYIALFMMCIIFLRTDFGRYAVIPAFLFSWITDTGAYFTGSFIGKNKLAKNLSPKKTKEGAVGGIITTLLGTVIYIAILKHGFNIIIDEKALLVVASVVGACLSEIGDLAASVVKRSCKIKDFGWIFPGHGGMMDRFDSVVFIAPYVYFVFLLMEYIK